MSNFSTLPSVSISRSKFLRNSQHKTSFNLGQLVPIYVDEVLPGDTRRIDIGSLIRMSTPVAPVMDNIYLDVYAFFVPNRLTWIHWKEFMGENSTGAGIYSGTEYTIPSVDVYSFGGVPVNSLGDHFGLPVLSATAGKSLRVSCLPMRAYWLIYNRFFRDQNLIAPVVLNNGDAVSGRDYPSYALATVAKKSDYFTRSLPYAQKGAPVSIPLGTSAPVSWNYEDSLAANKGEDIAIANGTGSAITKGSLFTDNPSDVAQGNNVRLNVDLSQATAATINQLRFAFQYQKLLEKDALYGTRYWEIIKAHFGVVAPDASLQDPEYLGHRRININVSQVLQTTGVNQVSPSSNELGATGAVSVTGDAGNICTKSFSEHGFIMILACARHDQTYGQGVERMWSRAKRTDFYFPVFANLGAQSVLNKEIFAQGTSSDNLAFGFQEAWAEYRYKPSKATGLLNPCVSNSLGYWTLSNNFASLPTLSQSFIEQDRNALARVLQTGSTGPDFIADFAFKDTAVRPMPLYSVPGLIDHH